MKVILFVINSDRLAAAVIIVVGLALWVTLWWSFYKIIENGFPENKKEYDAKLRDRMMKAKDFPMTD